VYTRAFLTNIFARILARKIARVGGQIGEDSRACPAQTNVQHHRSQLFLWQAERMTRRHFRDDPRDVGVGVRVGVGPVEFQL